jgi:hypothetical protein
MKSVHKHMAGMWDFAFAFQPTSDTTGKLLMYDDDQVWGVFLRFLVCPEVSTVFITHVYGTSAHGIEWDPRVVADVAADVPPWMWEEILPKLFSQDHVRPFNQADFEACRVQFYNGAIADCATVLSARLPYNVVRMIMRPTMPGWMLYAHNAAAAPEFPVVEEGGHDKYIAAHFDIMPVD